MKNKSIFKNLYLYFTLATFVLALVGLLLYAINCPSEFNGGKVSSAVVACDVVALVALAIALVCQIAEGFVESDGIICSCLKYRRFCIYVALICLLAGFFMEILDEYSLLGTILYPIVSGTVGDPVDGTLSASYFASLIITLVAFILAIVSSCMERGKIYAQQKAEEIGG